MPPRVVGRLWISYRETGECTRRQKQGRSGMTTPMQYRFLVLLSRRNQMSTAKMTSVVLLKFTCPTRLLGINSIMMISEPDDLPKAKFSLHNTLPCDPTLLASITTGRFVTGGQYSSQMRAVSLNQLMIDVLGCGDRRENVTQTVTLSKLTGTMGAIHGLDRDTLGWSYISVCVS